MKIKITDMKNGKFVYECKDGRFGYVTATSKKEARTMILDLLEKPMSGPGYADMLLRYDKKQAGTK